MKVTIRAWHILLLIVVLMALTGCGASYQYKHLNSDGSSCELSIWSAREVQAADLNISKNCALTGGAESLTTNEKAFDAINSLVNKIP